MAMSWMHYIAVYTMVNGYVKHSSMYKSSGKVPAPENSHVLQYFAAGVYRYFIICWFVSTHIFSSQGFFEFCSDSYGVSDEEMLKSALMLHQDLPACHRIYIPPG
ncbi:MAG: hypothetical protein ACLTDF_09590 [Coprococcus sp.]